MKQNNKQKGFSIIIIVLSVLVLAGLGLTGWYVWNKDQHGSAIGSSDNMPSQAQQKESKSEKNTQITPSDPSEGGKFLFLDEWGVRFALPHSLRGKVAYSLSEVMTDPDGNQIQAAKLLLKHEPSAGNSCTITKVSQGDFIDSAAQLLRVQKDKPFNKERYRWTFKEGILTDNAYVYHLNYVTPDCAGTSTISQIQELQFALERLLKS